MSTRVTNVRVKNGKLVRVHKMDAAKKKRIHAQAKREETAWTAKGKGRTR